MKAIAAKTQTFREFLSSRTQDSVFGEFASQAIRDPNWSGSSPQSLRNHLHLIGAPVESFDSLTEAARVWRRASK